MISRRGFLAGSVTLLVVPLTAEARLGGKVPRVGALTPVPSPRLKAVLQVVLRELGYVEGQNIVIEYRYWYGDKERIPALIAELIDLKVDVLVVTGTPAVLAAKKATRTIPIVMAPAADAMTFGLVASLNRPGGNVTGVSWVNNELTAKRLEFLKAAMPHVARVAFLFSYVTSAGLAESDVAYRSASTLGLTLVPFEVRDREELERACERMSKTGLEAVYVSDSLLLYGEQITLVSLLTNNRLAAMLPWTEAVYAGGLIGYAPSLPYLAGRAAAYVDRILKGARPADLPVEQPTKFDLVVNLKTAKALSLTIPPSLLLRADHVIE